METNVMINNESANLVNNLPAVEVIDNSTTKSVKSSGVKYSANTEESFTKNQVFSKLKNLFILKSLTFDESVITESMQPLVDNGIISIAAMNAAVEKARKEFNEKNKETLQAAENIPFDVFLEKLQANEKLYNEVCKVCKVSEITKNMVFDPDGAIIIYRGAQGTDNEGNNRYAEGTISRSSANGRIFEEKVYKEIRNENNVTNYIQAIRYYSNYSEVLQKLAKKVKDSQKVLDFAKEAIKNALNEGFSLEDITSAL